MIKEVTILYIRRSLFIANNFRTRMRNVTNERYAYASCSLRHSRHESYCPFSIKSNLFDVYFTVLSASIFKFFFLLGVPF